MKPAANGRFLAAPVAGVQRVARQVLTACRAAAAAESELPQPAVPSRSTD